MKRMKLAIAAITVAAACAWTAQNCPAETVSAKDSESTEAPQGRITAKTIDAEAHLSAMARRLGLSEDQAAKLKPILDEHFRAKQAVFADNNFTPDQRRAKMRELRDQLRSQINSILTPEQKVKLTHMWTAGTRGHGKKGSRGAGHHRKTFHMDPDRQLTRMTAHLGLSDDQKSKIKPLLNDYYKKKQATYADKKLSRDERRTKMRTLRKEFRTEVKTILTPEQIQQYDVMKSYRKPIKPAEKD